MHTSPFKNTRAQLMLWCFILLNLLSANLTAQVAGCYAQFTHHAGNVLYSEQFQAPSGGTTGITYLWDFGDGTTGNTINPQHVYAQGGNYYACLTVTVIMSNGTLCTANWCDSVHIGTPGTQCNAHYTYQHSSQLNGIAFYAPQSPPGATTTYSWDFGDGTTSNQPNPMHVYPTGGSFWTCLTVVVVVSGVPCTANWCDSVHAGININCDAHFTHQSNNTSGTVHFSNNQNPTGTTYAWDFGDGTTANIPSPNHTYAQPGAYYACLTVTLLNGTTVVCTSQWCDSIHVVINPTTCNAHFTHQLNPGSNNISFMSSGNPPGTVFSWSFGDGTSSTMASPSHTYTQPGVYYACLTVSVPGVFGGVACTDTWCDSVHVGPIQPNCDAHFATHLVNFANGLQFVPAPNAPGTTYAWDFGDGTTSTLLSPVHAYTAAGTYYACLTVTFIDINGVVLCTSQWCDSVHTGALVVPCNAHFTAVHDTTPLTMRFTTAPGNGVTTYSWNFGDGTSSTVQNPVHTFPGPGQYHVCLTITTLLSNGQTCTATQCQNIFLTPAPFLQCHARFFFFQLHNNTAYTFQFYNLNNNTAITSQWNFGDGTSSNAQNPVHQFPGLGSYLVCLTIHNQITGCTNTFCRTVNVIHPFSPQAPETVNDEKLADGNAVGELLPAAIIYPNPVTENTVMHLENTGSPVVFRVFDSTGRIVIARENLSDGDYELDGKSLVPGLYFYQFAGENEVISSGKLIVQ